MPKKDAKGARDRLERIVRKEAPGYRLAPEQRATRSADRVQRYAKPDASVPSMETIRGKYRERGPGADRAERTIPKPKKGEPRARIVKLEPEDAGTDARRMSPKTIIVSGKGKVISRQG